MCNLAISGHLPVTNPCESTRDAGRFLRMVSVGIPYGLLPPSQAPFCSISYSRGDGNALNRTLRCVIFDLRISQQRQMVCCGSPEFQFVSPLPCPTSGSCRGDRGLMYTRWQPRSRSKCRVSRATTRNTWQDGARLEGYLPLFRPD